MRAWFAAFIGWMVLLTLVALLSFQQYEAGTVWAAGVWILALMCFYLSLCNALLPLPTAWIVMLGATDQVADYADPWLRVLCVVVCGSIATVMANLNEYHLLSHRAGAELRAWARRSAAYRWAIRWFDVAPFHALMLVAFVPLPVDVVRWLAILRRYPRWRFATAYFVGRAARYLLLAGAAVLCQLTWWQILLIQAGILLLAALSRLFWRGRSATASATPDPPPAPQAD